jgi:hypothetical protein
VKVPAPYFADPGRELVLENRPNIIFFSYICYRRLHDVKKFSQTGILRIWVRTLRYFADPGKVFFINSIF